MAGDVTDHDLTAACDRFSAGQLSSTQLERVHRAWVRGEKGTPELERPAED